jgi:hypothetical protein
LPRFSALTASDDHLSGVLLEIDEGWSIKLGDPANKQIAGSELVELRRAGARLPAYPAGMQAILANGDRIAATSLKLNGETLRMRVAGQDMDVPLSGVTVLWFAAPEGADHPEIVRRRLAKTGRKSDLVLLRNGDKLDGFLGALDEEKIDIDAGKKPVSVRRANAAAVAFNKELANAARPRGLYGKVVLGDGTRLSLLSAQCQDGKTLKGKTAFGAPVQLALSDIVALYPYQGAVTYLSDLKPKSYQHTPYLGVRWPLAEDASVAGRDLSIGGDTYDKGLGMHSEARVTYDVPPGQRYFDALVGLNDHTGRSGSVGIKVLVDSKLQNIGGDRDVTWSSGPLPIRVGIADAKELTLIVEFGKRGDVGDHVDWANARFVK